MDPEEKAAESARPAEGMGNRKALRKRSLCVRTCSTQQEWSIPDHTKACCTKLRRLDSVLRAKSFR